MKLETSENTVSAHAPEQAESKMTDVNGIVERLRSATFLLGETEASELHPGDSQVIDWVQRYNEWFMEAIGLSEGSGVHFLYDREITLVSDKLLHHVPAVIRIGEAVRLLGFGFSITIDAWETATQRAALRQLLEANVVTSIGVNLAGRAVAGSPERVLSMLEEMAQGSASLGIIGDIEMFTRVGAFDSAVLSRTDLTWYPVSSPSGGDARAAANPVRQCYSRFRLFVDEDGEIFPCLGLVGIPAGSLGNITQPLKETGLCLPAVMRELDIWNREGPPISEQISGSRQGSLPPMCEIHRAVLGF